MSRFDENVQIREKCRVWVNSGLVKKWTCHRFDTLFSAVLGFDIKRLPEYLHEGVFIDDVYYAMRGPDILTPEYMSVPQLVPICLAMLRLQLLLSHQSGMEIAPAIIFVRVSRFIRCALRLLMELLA